MKKLKMALVFGVVTATMPVISSTSALADCKAFPEYRYWSTLTHKRATNYVDRKLKGDWQPYLSHLQKQIVKIEDITATGTGARLKHKGKHLVLKGEKLDEYLNVSKARLDVVQCLADEQDIAKLDSFATAAGDEDDVTEVAVTKSPTIAKAKRLKLAISTSCSNGVSKFRIENEGADWPKSSAFSLYRIEGDKKYPVSARRMRLKKGQIASFTVNKARNPSGTLGLFVGPSWYQRAFAYDATLVCR